MGDEYKESSRMARNLVHVKDPKAFRLGVKMLVRQIEKENEVCKKDGEVK